MSAGPKLSTEVAVNVLSAVLRAVALLWLMRAAGMIFAPAALGILLLARRHTTTIAAFLSLGSTQTIQRYASIHREDPETARAYVLLPILVLFACAAPVLVAAWVWRAPLAGLLFADPARGGLATIVIAYALVSILTMLIISSLMAQRRVLAYNILSLASVGVFPLVGIFAVRSSPDVDAALSIALMLGLVSSVLAALLVFHRTGWSWPDRTRSRAAAREFGSFGLYRAVGVGLDAMMLTVGAWWLSDTPEQASYLLIALTLIRLAEMILAPVSIVLGLASARLVDADAAATRALVARMVVFCTWAGVLGMAFLYPAIDALLYLWLGQEDLAVGTAAPARILVWVLPLSLLYYGLRGMIDLRWKMPCNLLTQIAGLVVFLAVTLPFGPVLGTAAMIATTGLVSLLWLRRDLPRAHRFDPVRLGFVATSIAVSVSWAAAQSWPVLVAVMLIGGLAAIVAARWPRPIWFLRADMG